MIKGELKTCWATEPLSVEFDAGKDAFEVCLSCKHHNAISLVSVGQIKAIIKNAKTNHPWLINQIQKWIGEA